MTQALPRSLDLDDALEAIKTVTLSRAAVETSTPEQIVWLTTDAIGEKLRWVGDNHPGFLHATTLDRIEADVLAAIANSTIPERHKTLVLQRVKEALSGWPT